MEAIQLAKKGVYVDIIVGKDNLGKRSGITMDVFPGEPKLRRKMTLAAIKWWISRLIKVFNKNHRLAFFTT